jgi:formate-dependent nitrite reductase membrane component NrfD
MRDQIPGTNVTIFVLFFLLSMLEAFSRQNWMVAVLWLMVGLLFLRADLPRRRKR